MTEPEQALRDTSDALLRDLEVLISLEEQKRALAAGDPGLVELAARIEVVARRALVRSAQQRRLTETARVGVAAGDADPGPSIEATPSRPLATVLEEWRASERRLAAAEPGSADALEAEALIAALRDEYRRAYDARI